MKLSKHSIAKAEVDNSFARRNTGVALKALVKGKI